MGYAIANELANAGAKVILVSGPVQIKNTNPEITVIPVESASEMYERCMRVFPNTDGAVMCAAVADFTPENYSENKIRREKENLFIQLKATPDIAAQLGQLKSEKQILVGFALETNNELSNAFAKLERKNLDFIVLNSLNDPGAGFGWDSNRITIIDKHNKQTFYELKSKTEVAADIVNRIIVEMHKKSGQ
jgi:phosphopantothenoylcysteine decarboxylase / phosphopantothenate---cysteine ligase